MIDQQVRRIFRVLAFATTLLTAQFSLAEEAAEAAPAEPDLLTQYMETMALVDSLRVYNAQQEVLVQDQRDEMTEVQASIDQIDVVRRQLGPITERMIASLETFIELDLPFRLEERRDRVARLRTTFERVDLSASEKFNQVLQAYQEEIKYSSSKEAYNAFVEIEGRDRQVMMLRWGRTVLAFQTPDGSVTGAWDPKAREWKVLGDEFSTGVRSGIRIAKETMTADLVLLPVYVP